MNGIKDSVTIFNLVFTLIRLEWIFVRQRDIQVTKKIKKHIFCSLLADNISNVDF